MWCYPAYRPPASFNLICSPLLKGGGRNEGKKESRRGRGKGRSSEDPCGGTAGDKLDARDKEEGQAVGEHGMVNARQGDLCSERGRRGGE